MKKIGLRDGKRSVVQIVMGVLAGLGCLGFAGIQAACAQADPRYGVCYEVFVYSFYDSDGNGIGDLQGLTQQLDYINDGDESTTEDLGCDQLWLMPVFPSPTYHKYDVTDYMAIDPAYGTMEDFEALLEACNARGIRVILDLPLNHTSTEHPWFRAAVSCLQEGSLDFLLDKQETSTSNAEEDASEREYPRIKQASYSDSYVDYYDFSVTPQDGYVPLEGTDYYYEARFWEGMPDLNLDNDAVRSEIRDILAFWLEKGVYGFRLDAVTSYYTGDTKQNIAFLSWLNETVKEIRPDAYLVGEAWEDVSSYAALYESGVDSFFDFSMAGESGVIANVVRGSSGAGKYAKALVSEEARFAEVSEQAVNAPFYTNHDMARSAGYYSKEAESRIKLAGALNLLTRGNAFVYYGEELGMNGSGKDENKRAPMYWSADPAAEGMCQGPPDMDDVEMRHGSFAEQKEDPYSIYAYFRTAIHLRQSLPVLSQGSTTYLEELSSKRVCVLRRTLDEARSTPGGDQTRSEDATFDGRKTSEEAIFDEVLIVINTSDEAQTAALGSILGTMEEETQDKLQVPLSSEEKAPCGSWQVTSLTMDEEAAVLEDGTLTLPPFAVGIFLRS